MKKMIKNILQPVFCVLLFAGIYACNKEAAATKAISIEMRGFNIGSTELEISVDTVIYRKSQVGSNSELNFGSVYTYPDSKKEATLSIRDIHSGATVYQQQLSLNNTDLERFYPFVFIDGKQLELKPPAADATTNKIGFYIHYLASNDPIDVFMKNSEEQIVYLAKNVQTSTWVYANYTGTEGFNNPNTNYNVYFTKSGTTDSWAFNDNEWMSTSNSFSMFLPLFPQTGRVCSYFVTPGTVDLRVVRLFKAPQK